MPAFCSNCGNTLPPNARFCSVCGTVIAGAAGFQPMGFPPQPRLVRPIFGRQFAGVCIGMAQTYGWDVGLVRILTIIGAVFGALFITIMPRVLSQFGDIHAVLFAGCLIAAVMFLPEGFGGLLQRLAQRAGASARS